MNEQADDQRVGDTWVRFALRFVGLVVLVLLVRLLVVAALM